MKKSVVILFKSIALMVILFLTGQIGLAQDLTSERTAKQTAKLYCMPIEISFPSDRAQNSIDPTNKVGSQTFCGARLSTKGLISETHAKRIFADFLY